MLRSLTGRAKHIASYLWLSARISSKWRRDCRSLPLTTAHRELYDIIHRLCWRELRDFPDLINCRDYNDRIQWLKLFDQDLEIVRCSDKIKVRDYIRERVGAEYLVKLYQVHDHFDEIDFESLPDAFVIKTNHDSGSVILVRDKKEFNREDGYQKIEGSLVCPYGWTNGEWAYSYVRPKVLVEGFIGNPNDRPADYRFHCCNGAIAWIQNDIPYKGHFKEVSLHPDGFPLGIHFSSHKYYSEEAVIPNQWELMKKLAITLSKGWKYIRVDMFVSKSQVYCGELTFYPYRGIYLGEGQRKMGQFIDFDLSSVKPLVLPELEMATPRKKLYPNCQLLQRPSKWRSFQTSR